MQELMIIASILLFLNATLLTVLVPGGPIENRDFSHLRGGLFWGFNLFLILLGITSYITCYLLLISHDQSVLMAQVIAVLYFLVYALDLAGVFPKSPTKMSRSLMLMELINASMALFLFVVATAIHDIG